MALSSPLFLIGTGEWPALRYRYALLPEPSIALISDAAARCVKPAILATEYYAPRYWKPIQRLHPAEDP